MRWTTEFNVENNYESSSSTSRPRSHRSARRIFPAAAPRPGRPAADFDAANGAANGPDAADARNAPDVRPADDDALPARTAAQGAQFFPRDLHDTGHDHLRHLAGREYLPALPLRNSRLRRGHHAEHGSLRQSRRENRGDSRRG